MEPPMFIIRFNPVPAVVTIPPKKLGVVVPRAEVHQIPFTAVDAPPVYGSVRHGQQAGGNSCETAIPTEQNNNMT